MLFGGELTMVVPEADVSFDEFKVINVTFKVGFDGVMVGGFEMIMDIAP